MCKVMFTYIDIYIYIRMYIYIPKDVQERVAAASGRNLRKAILMIEVHLKPSEDA